MARNIFTDEGDRRALGIVRVASTVPPAAAQRHGRDVGAAHIEAPAWAITWSRVAVTR